MPVSTITSEMEIVLRSFCHVFPEVGLFFFPDKDVLMVGAKRPLAGRPHMTDEEFKRADASDALAHYRIESPEQILAFRIAGRQQLVEILGPGLLATWDHNIIEFTTFKANGQHLMGSTRDNILRMYAASQVNVETPSLLDDIDPALRQSTELIQRAYALLVKGTENRAAFLDAYATAEKALQADPGNSSAEYTRTIMAEVLKAQGLTVPQSPTTAQ